METRVAVIAIIVKDAGSVAALNDLLHQYGGSIIGNQNINDGDVDIWLQTGAELCQRV